MSMGGGGVETAPSLDVLLGWLAGGGVPAELSWTGKNDDEPKGHAPGQGLPSPACGAADLSDAPVQLAVRVWTLQMLRRWESWLRRGWRCPVQAEGEFWKHRVG